MEAPRISLEWWPPPAGERIGEERALELVAALRRIAAPVVEAAENDLRQRVGPHAEIVGSGAPAAYLARFALDPQVRSLCVGTVEANGTGDPERNSLHLDRDGRLTWRRG